MITLQIVLFELPFLVDSMGWQQGCSRGSSNSGLLPSVEPGRFDAFRDVAPSGKRGRD